MNLNENHIQDLATLLYGEASVEERERVLQLVAEDEAARDVLLLAGCPGMKESVLSDIPFAVLSDFTAGVCENYLRVFNLQGVELSAGGVRITEAVRRISGGRLPLCLARRVEVLVELEPFVDPVKLIMDVHENRIRLTIGAEERIPGHFEVWRNGSLVRAVPVSAASKREISDLEPGVHLAVRHSKSSSGMSLIFLPFEFEFGDWMSVCLHRALSGHISEAVRILTTRLARFAADSAGVARTVSKIKSLGAVTKSDLGVLVPRPVVRSRVVFEDDRKAAYRLVWEGILACWPEAAVYENPWSEEGPSGGAKEAFISEDVLGLVRTTVGVARGQVDPKMATTVSPEPNLVWGFAALRGWGYLLEGEFEKAREEFGSYSPAEHDPFHMEISSLLAEHLCKSGGRRVTSESVASSDGVWHMFLSDVL